MTCAAETGGCREGEEQGRAPLGACAGAERGYHGGAARGCRRPGRGPARGCPPSPAPAESKALPLAATARKGQLPVPQRGVPPASQVRGTAALPCRCPSPEPGGSGAGPSAQHSQSRRRRAPRPGRSRSFERSPAGQSRPGARDERRRGPYLAPRRGAAERCETEGRAQPALGGRGVGWGGSGRLLPQPEPTRSVTRVAAPARSPPRTCTSGHGADRRAVRGLPGRGAAASRGGRRCPGTSVRCRRRGGARAAGGCQGDRGRGIL